MSQLTCAIEDLLRKPNTEFVNTNGRWYTTTDIQQAVQRVEQILLAANLRPGERVLIGYPNSYVFVVTYLAVLQTGAIAVPVNPNMPAAELHTCLA